MHIRWLKKNLRRIQKLLFAEQWSILVCDAEGAVLKNIAPPKDRMWADPFPVEWQGHYYIFVEQQFNRENGTLGFIELYDDLSHSDFTPILEKDYHLSYPNIFPVPREGGETWYMIPESNEHNAIELYRATDFPSKWEHDRTLIANIQAVDTSIFHYEGRWYLFTSCKNDGISLNHSLSLFSSDSFPASLWKAHPGNPVKIDAADSRMGGRVFVDAQGRIMRPAQSCVREYGEKLILNHVTKLSESDFQEEKLREIVPEKKYHAVCTHTWNQCGKYIVRDIKTRRFRLFI